MQRIEPPDTHFLSAAAGWLGLGNVPEAKLELGQISPGQQDHPDVLELRWVISAEERDWDDGLRIARQLVEAAPERSSGWLHQAYALRRVTDGGLQKALDALLPAFNQFPDEPTIPYNLACYTCQMDQMDTARMWLKRAAAIGGKESIKTMALEDPDLEPLWVEIKGS